MVIDTSAILAILLGEPEAEKFIRALALDPKKLVSAFSVLEAAVVIHARKGPSGAQQLDLFMHASAMETVSMNKEQAQIAREAYVRFGKGYHPAALNLGDCCSYALARLSEEPLLYKGEDFSKTDVPSVL
jgi:ribonuclease VapC